MNDSAAWDEAIKRGSAYQRDGKLEDAAATWSAVIEGGDDEFAPVAAELLGSLRLYEQDRAGDAEALFALAVESGNRKAGARALAGLAELRYREGKNEEAEASAQRAELAREAGDMRAAELLAIVLTHLRRFDDAGALWQEVVDSGEAGRVPQALLMLGWIRSQQGRAAEARVAYRRASEAGDPSIARQASDHLRGMSRLRRAVRILLPVAWLIVVFRLPHGWPRALGFLAIVPVFLVIGWRRHDRRSRIEALSTAAAAVVIAVMELTDRHASWSDPAWLAVVAVGAVLVASGPVADYWLKRSRRSAA
jgi:tetratricopeptide (TPR) repeat protein